MSLTTADKLFVVVGLIDFAGLFAVIGYTLYLANTKMDVLLKTFKNSSGVIALASLGLGGLREKMMIVGGVSGYVTFPRFYIRRGVLDVEDFKGVSKALKRQLVALQWAGIASLLVMFGLAVVVELNAV